MTIRENVSLAPFTTFKIGGPARYFVTVQNLEDVRQALALARERNLPIRVLGGGSNILVPDEGVRGFVLKVEIGGIAVVEEDISVLLSVGAGVPWNEVVAYATERGWWGIENLAGIPGTAGGAAVQNIGAYGAELSSVFVHADVMTVEGEVARITRTDARFAYRTSAFKRNRGLLVIGITLRLRKDGAPELSYPDLAKRVERGESLSTPFEIAAAVRDIRRGKFPPPELGTAGSFFHNPTISLDRLTALRVKYPELPSFPMPRGERKIPLAWILDRALNLKGFALGRARLYEKQPLVLVAEEGATAAEVNTLACEVERRTRETIALEIAREVETFGA